MQFSYFYSISLGELKLSEVARADDKHACDLLMLSIPFHKVYLSLHLYIWGENQISESVNVRSNDFQYKKKCIKYKVLI